MVATSRTERVGKNIHGGCASLGIRRIRSGVPKIQAIYHRLTSPSYRNDKREGVPMQTTPSIRMIYPSAPVRRQRLNASRRHSRTLARMHDLSLLTMNYRVPFAGKLTSLALPRRFSLYRLRRGRVTSSGHLTERRNDKSDQPAAPFRVLDSSPTWQLKLCWQFEHPAQ